ncbi:hypothetical protein OG244_28310 [Streptomyces brevispora]|uniref:hypothetical protein n=1 Tax=Streptomyces brevispora TaxID=887462 RepID=UPI002E35FF48|nr:hypothetical protein [Streptomyces brevispora]
MTERIPLDDLTSDQLDQLYERLDLLQRGAVERSALLEEARDALETAGINEAHGGESWPRLVPAIEQLAKRAEQAEDLLRVAHETSNRSEAERARAAATIECVRQLHQPAPGGSGGSGGLSFNSGARCNACDHPYRCDTIRTLDQAQQPTATEAPC